MKIICTAEEKQHILINNCLENFEILECLEYKCEDSGNCEECFTKNGVTFETKENEVSND